MSNFEHRIYTNFCCSVKLSISNFGSLQPDIFWRAGNQILVSFISGPPVAFCENIFLKINWLGKIRGIFQKIKEVHSWSLFSSFHLNPKQKKKEFSSQIQFLLYYIAFQVYIYFKGFWKIQSPNKMKNHLQHSFLQQSKLMMETKRCFLL